MTDEGLGTRGEAEKRDHSRQPGIKRSDMLNR